MTPPSAVIDLGSNSFRLVIFDSDEDGCWQRTEDRSEMVRLGGGVGPGGALAPQRVAHALATLGSFAEHCAASGIPPERIDAVATSAIREAPNGEELVREAQRRTGLPVRVLSATDEARYAYVAAVNSSSLRDGLVLDLGGGSLELVEVRARRPGATASWPLGAVRVTERFLPGSGPASGAALQRLRAHVARELEQAPWASETPGPIVGVGGTVRTLATAAIRAADLPLKSAQGFLLSAEALGGLVEELAAHPPQERDRVPGIKRNRAPIVLGGAVVLQAVLETLGAPGIEVTRAGLREGVFLSAKLAPADPPLIPDVRAASVRSLACDHDVDLARVRRAAGRAQALVARRPRARSLVAGAEDLVETAALLHAVPCAAILRAGLPGFTARETVLVAAMAGNRGTRAPRLDRFRPILAPGDAERAAVGAALVRIAARHPLGG